jgi:hypothetical protein
MIQNTGKDMNDISPSFSVTMAEAVDRYSDNADFRDETPINNIVQLINHYAGDGDYTPSELAGQFTWHIISYIGPPENVDYYIGLELDALEKRGAIFNHATALGHAMLLDSHYL